MCIEEYQSLSNENWLLDVLIFSNVRKKDILRKKTDCCCLIMKHKNCVALYLARLAHQRIS